MEKINFVNGQAPAINGTNLNQLQTNVEEAIEDAMNNVKIQAATLHTFTKKSGNIATGTWSTLCEDLSVNLEAGKYMLIFTVGVTGAANGVTSFNPVINGSRTAIQARSSVPIGSSLQTNAQCIVPLTVETATTYTFNIHEYSNAANTVSTAGLYIYKLS